MIKVNHSIQKEIIRYQEQLRFFRISLQHLPVNTPADPHTRRWCRDVAWKLAETHTLSNKVFKSRKLPYREISKQFLVKVSSLKRNSKYIIALFLLRHGDYDLLHNHLTSIL